MSNFYNNKSIIELYTKIPDYAQVKHLGNSEFINQIEKLKEEFRQIRSSLYEDSDHDYEIDSVVDSTRKLKLDNSDKCNESKFTSDYNTKIENPSGNSSAYLSISSCQLYRPSEALLSNRPASTENRKYGSTVQLERYESISPNDSGHSSQDNVSESANISRWSSSPEISKRRFNHYIPPKNIETRLAVRKKHNKPSLGIGDNEHKSINLTRKSHSVPSHVTKPLFYKIMLKNKRRSDKVKQQSKQRLLAQVKPFVFCKSSLERGLHNQTQGQDDPDKDLLNNERPLTKSKKHAVLQNINNKLGPFVAKPAPPRTKALMAALRLKEQQEYRELKKRLRAEALMKLSTFPPSMEARHQADKSNKVKLQNLLRNLQDERNEIHNTRFRKESAGNTNGTNSDEDQFAESPFLSDQDQPSSSGKYKPSKSKTFSKSNNLFDYSKQNDRSRLFETTSNDNHASRLRIEAAKRKEAARIRRDEEEQLRLMKIEQKRNKLKDWHINVWRRACSYSSNQDIAMRKQLRDAASIVERENFRKDMSNMLTRVRSAPLLLEGVRERKFEPCHKHKQEMLQLSGRSSKFNTPRLGFGKEKYFSRMNWTSLGEDRKLNRGGGDKSETVALAEGSASSTSDNESLNNDSDPDESEKELEPSENQEADEYTAIEKEVDDIIGQGEPLD